MALLVLLLPPLPRPGAAQVTAASPTGSPGLAADPAPLVWLLSPDGLRISQQGEGPAAECPKADTVVAVLPALSVAWHRPIVPRAPASRLRAALGGVLEDHLLADDEQVHLALAPRHTPGEMGWVAATHKPALQAQLASLAAAGLVVDRLVPALAPVLGGAARGGAAADSRWTDTTQGGDSVQPSQQPSGQSGSFPASAQGQHSPSSKQDSRQDSIFSSLLGASPEGHFFTRSEAAGASSVWVALADTDHALCLPLAGNLARGVQERWSALGASWSATPAAAAVAEQWLGAPLAMRSAAEQALAAVRSPWNLLQFDLAPQHRSSLALGRLARQFFSPAWAPARWGLAALVVLQLAGLNGMAWQQQRSLAYKRAALEAVLRSSHPQVRAVLDAPAQMQRETATLRSAAGIPGEDDFEPMLAAAAAAWPDGQPPAAQLRFEPGRLSLAASGWQAPQISQLRSRLQPTGWAVDNAEGRLVIQRAPAPAGP